jgi:hypothetical protein
MELAAAVKMKEREKHSLPVHDLCRVQIINLGLNNYTLPIRSLIAFVLVYNL